MFDFTTPYTDMFTADIKRMLSKSKPAVLHRRTCPLCKRKLVNLYASYLLDAYACKKCLDKVFEGSEAE